MAHDDVLTFLRELDRLHDRLGRHTSELLLHTDGLGDDRELLHELRTDRRDDDAVRVTLLHRFVVPLAPGGEGTHEVDFTAAVTVAEGSCAARVAVDVHLDAPVAALPEGPSVLWERRADGVDLDGALRFLASAVEELHGLEDPFGPLTTHHQ
ncbi:hypothetical protein [Streptomyces roseolilacinus]|jgi:hypothetical protein|uniref:hypothetical protein n=1 Tax=Streptomyces roseolilacinus TaxID=66904 RepID=UPI00380F755A